jgi:hypothetical protein
MFAEMRSKLHPTNNARLLLNQLLRKIPERIDAIQGKDRQTAITSACSLLLEDESAM